MDGVIPMWRSLIVVCWLMSVFTGAHAQRVALLVGNANYSVGRLSNPPNDVAVMESALKAVGFKVQKVLNANQNQMKRAVRDFGTAAQGAEVAFVYYSGHGTQANGENYLLPLGASIDKESDYAIEAIAANDVLQQIRGAQPKAAILVLDACRDNPLAATTKSATKGLGRMSAPTGTMIAFATAPGDTASDNGHYARVLARELQKPGQELVDVFRSTAAEVRRLSTDARKQDPRISEMSINERLYLAGPGTQVASLTSEPTGRPSQSDPEDEAWQAAKAANRVAAYDAYLADYPRGKFASAARISRAAAQGGASQPSQQNAPTQTIQGCGDCPEMVTIPGGSFQMGGAESEAEANEKPVHSVNVKSFAIGKYEVTQGQFAAFVADSRYDAGNSCYVPADGKWGSKTGHNWQNPNFSQTDRDPVACVNWNDAQAFAQWLTQKTGQSYRLPTEAEWEYACRGGKQQQYCGSEDINAVAWYYQNSEAKTQAVGQKAANGFGLYDMSGNVWEWVQDGWYGSYQGAPNDGSERTAGANTSKRVLRGGAWSLSAKFARAAIRINPSSDLRYSNSGFRLARNIP